MLSVPWLPLAILIGLPLVGYLTLGGVTPDGVVPDGGTNVGAAKDDRVRVDRTFVRCSWKRQSECVIDGDTVRHGGVTIRLLDINAPETHEPACTAEAALGRRATERLIELMNQGSFEVVAAGDRDEDVYGRKLRLLMRHGRSFGDILVAEGLARPWRGRRGSWCG